MKVGEKVNCSKTVYCIVTDLEKTSLLFDVYKNDKKVNRREFWDPQGLDLDQVKRSMVFEFKDL